MEIRGVKVSVHWSVLLIGAFILLGAVENPLLAFVVLLSYYGVILGHECGHLVVAQKMKCAVHAIELYPFWGITHFEMPYSQKDHALIAWGGVLAQGMVAVPLIAFVEIFGFTRFQTMNAFLAIFGFLSLGVACFNLLPVRPLDGAIAWRLLPAIFRRAPVQISRRESSWRPWR